MKAASSYLKNGKIYIHPSSKTTAGVWILSEPVIVLDCKESSKNLGSAVIDALNSSKEQMPHPTTWKSIFDPILKLSGSKSWNNFVKSTRCVEIELDENIICFIPTLNQGEKEGFSQLSSKKISVNSLSVTYDKMGECLLEVFNNCEF
jgi:hypothetical protein